MTTDIKSLIDSKILARFWSKVSKGSVTSCWEWQGTKSDRGYGTIEIDGKCFRAHRMSWIINCGPIPDNLLVCHQCDNRICVNPSHLWLGTVQDNNQDRVNKKRTITTFVSGSKHPNSKLKEEQVLLIRRDTRFHHIIAIDYGISPSVVARIKSGESWWHVPTTGEGV